MHSTTFDLSETEITRRLALTQAAEANHSTYPDSPYPSELLPDAPRPAAVLIPMLRKDNLWHVLFTRRTSTLAEHSGQVAFPGGRSEPNDHSPEGTALREAQEEIGLNPADVRILGRLNTFTTITNYRVTPVVGLIPWPYPLHLATVEVSRAFTIPLDWLVDPANYEVHSRSLPPPYGTRQVIYYHPYDNEVLWGASARFTLALVRNLRLDSTSHQSK